VAARQIRKERFRHTLQPTALVHEAYLQLLKQKDKDWKNRAHFYAFASQVNHRGEPYVKGRVARGEAPETDEAQLQP
jgi:hypothetical protein